MSSDAKSSKTDDEGRPIANAIGYRHTWIKMSEPSIEALRQAFLDPTSRVRCGGPSPAEGERHARLESLDVRGAEFLDDVELALSPNLNCFVGGRGTGKSTLLEYARLCLRRDVGVVGRAAEQIERIRGTPSERTRLGLRCLRRGARWPEQRGGRAPARPGGDGRPATSAGGEARPAEDPRAGAKRAGATVDSPSHSSRERRRLPPSRAGRGAGRRARPARLRRRALAGGGVVQGRRHRRGGRER